MPKIDFTDVLGAATVQSGWPTPANRFANWVPNARPIGEGANALGDGRRYLFEFRVDNTAAFEIPGIPHTDLDIVLRLCAHLVGGGFCAVTTDDTLASIYSECGLAPDTEPELSFSDRPTLEYTLRLTLLDVSATPTQLLCVYQ